MLSIRRDLLDTAAGWLGVYYPPTVLLMLLIMMVFIASLYFSVIVSRQRQQIERLIEETAILAAELRDDRKVEPRTLRAAVRKAACQSSRPEPTRGRRLATGDPRRMSTPPLKVEGVSKSFRFPACGATPFESMCSGSFVHAVWSGWRCSTTSASRCIKVKPLPSWVETGRGRARCFGSCPASIRQTRDESVQASITPILELGVGWNPELDAVDNVFLIGTVMGLSLAEIRRSLPEILEFAELERFANLKLKHYSNGMSSRLAYSVAFRAVREVLVLDEIFAVGDAGFKERCEKRFRELHALGHTIVIVGHDPRIIGTFCDRALLIDGGKIVCAGASATVADAYLSLLTGPDQPATGVA